MYFISDCTKLLENLLPLYRITDTDVQKITQVCSKILLIHVNELIQLLFVKDLVAKKKDKKFLGNGLKIYEALKLQF